MSLIYLLCVQSKFQPYLLLHANNFDHVQHWKRALSSAVVATRTTAGGSVTSKSTDLSTQQHQLSIKDEMRPHDATHKNGTQSVPVTESMQSTRRTTLFTACSSLCLRCARADKLGVRAEAQDRGVWKVNTEYFEDFNTLEATFLFGSIVILACGAMFKSADFVPG